MKNEHNSKRRTLFFKFVITEPHPIFAEQIYEKNQDNAMTCDISFIINTPYLHRNLAVY